MSLYHLLYVQSISSRDPSISLPHLTLDPEGILASFCKTGNMDRYCILQDGMGGFPVGRNRDAAVSDVWGSVFSFFFSFFARKLGLMRMERAKRYLGVWDWLVGLVR